jgi:hypothetical protein
LEISRGQLPGRQVFRATGRQLSAYSVEKLCFQTHEFFIRAQDKTRFLANFQAARKTEFFNRIDQNQPVKLSYQIYLIPE